MSLEDQVYIATYCNTDVFESVINGIPLMRRCSDDWINATQILRIANFPKNRRTKILEKQVQIHTHEKVQGGYGRFQGTWIPLEIARNLATEYGIDASIAPLLYSDSKELVATPFKRKGKPGRNLGIDNDINPSPTKIPKSSEKRKNLQKKRNEKAVKKLKFAQAEDMLANGAFLQHHQAVQLQQQQQHLQGIPPPPQFMPVQHAQSMSQQQQQQQQQQMFQQFNFASAQGQQQQQPAYASFYQNPYNIPQFQPQQGILPMQQQLPPHLHPQQQQQILHPQHQQQQQQQHQPSNSQDSLTSNVFSTAATDDRRNSDTSIFSNHSVTLISPPVITSQPHSQAHVNGHNNSSMLIQEEPDEDEDDDEDGINATSSVYTTQLLNYFEKDGAKIPKFLYNPPADFKPNFAIDDEGHTPLHWAAALANLPIIEVLIGVCNANPVVSNNAGVNCLSKMVFFNNSYELGNFPQILELFKICLVTPDFNARVPLHYLMELSAQQQQQQQQQQNPQQARQQSSVRYYIDEIIKFAENLASESNKNLLRILLNHQDINGDTALHLCARGGEKNLVKLLLAKGADVDICNAMGVSCKNLISIEVLEEFQKESSSSLSLPQQLPTPVAGPASAVRYKSKRDFIEDKENIFVENSLHPAEFKMEIEIPASSPDHAAPPQQEQEQQQAPPSPVEEEEETATQQKSLLTFQDKIPSLISSLNESFVEQITEKDEEYNHNLAVYQASQDHLADLTRQIRHKSKTLFQTANVKVSSIDARVAQLESNLAARQRSYLAFLEKSQSLQLAKFVQQQEQQLLSADSTSAPVNTDTDATDPASSSSSSPQSSTTHDTEIEAAIRISLQQHRRKRLISGLITTLVASQSGEHVRQRKIVNYKRLISKACGLDDINDELLDDIEAALAVK